MTGYERSWRPLSLIHKPPPHAERPWTLPRGPVSFRKPPRNTKHAGNAYVHNRKRGTVTL